MRSLALALIAGSETSDLEALLDEIVTHSTKNFKGRSAGVFQIRTLIAEDFDLLQEICDAQIEMVQDLHERMMGIAGKQRSPMSNAALSAVVNAFSTAVQNLAKHNSDRSVDAKTRRRLLSSLLTGMSEEEPKSKQ